MYKDSKYNYFISNAEGDLLLYNTMAKRGGLLKVRKPHRESVQKVLEGQEKAENLPADVLVKLVDGGFVVPFSECEELKLKSLYLDRIADPSLHLTVLPTEQCNFRCKYCYESFPDTYMDQDTQDALISFLSKNISRYKDLHVSWFGGEPLLAVDTILSLSERMMEICRRHRKSYTASMTTNGYLLDIDTFRKLIKAKVLYYQITIDGLRDTHNNQRPLKEEGGPSFDRILTNLEAIHNEIRSGMFRITIRTNFSRDLLDTIPEYKRFFGERFGNDPRFQFFFRPVMNWGGERIKDFQESLFQEELMSDIYRITMETEPRLRFIYEDFLQPGSGICEAAKQNYYTILPNGDIFKCTCDFGNTPKAKIGHLSLKRGMELNPQHCAEWLCDMTACKNDCFFAPNCLRDCCPAQRILPRKSKTKCPLEKRNLPMTLLLLDKENQSFQEV